MSFQDGPKVTIAATCSGCRHLTDEDYCYEDGNDVDSGVILYCTHPDTKDQGGRHHDKMRIADTRWDTPAWCPLLDAAIAKMRQG